MSLCTKNHLFGRALDASVVLLFLLPGLASATAYTEPPDLPSSISAPFALPTFGLGLNTISGSVDHLAGDDADAFLISLPAGASLSTISLAISNLTLEAGSVAEWGVNWLTSPGPVSAGGFNTTANSTVWPLSATSPVTLGMSEFTLTAGANSTGGLPFANFSSYTYQWQFTVVPEPAAIGLLTLGCLLVAGPRRGRSHRHAKN